ncbi:hypothetical protein TGCAST_239365 [Toxoplasma gondii CAST]|uniref:Uncharacterized protein n=1 Tax=Toxoplasma gondii CAST TaxID=943122 RepID=A0A425HWW8_TOXGO|nr:hypothetical protein TGCAST_239365 [Toxoplasma gondii CAST]
MAGSSEPGVAVSCVGSTAGKADLSRRKNRSSCAASFAVVALLLLNVLHSAQRVFAEDASVVGALKAAETPLVTPSSSLRVKAPSLFSEDKNELSTAQGLADKNTLPQDADDQTRKQVLTKETPASTVPRDTVQTKVGEADTNSQKAERSKAGGKAEVSEEPEQPGEKERTPEVETAKEDTGGTPAQEKKGIQSGERIGHEDSEKEKQPTDESTPGAGTDIGGKTRETQTQTRTEVEKQSDGKLSSVTEMSEGEEAKEQQKEQGDGRGERKEGKKETNTTSSVADDRSSPSSQEEEKPSKPGIQSEKENGGKAPEDRNKESEDSGRPRDNSDDEDSDDDPPEDDSEDTDPRVGDPRKEKPRVDEPEEEKHHKDHPENDGPDEDDSGKAKPREDSSDDADPREDDSDDPDPLDAEQVKQDKIKFAERRRSDEEAEETQIENEREDRPHTPPPQMPPCWRVAVIGDSAGISASFPDLTTNDLLELFEFTNKTGIQMRRWPGILRHFLRRPFPGFVYTMAFEEFIPSGSEMVPPFAGVSPLDVREKCEGSGLTVSEVVNGEEEILERKARCEARRQGETDAREEPSGDADWQERKEQGGGQAEMKNAAGAALRCGADIEPMTISPGSEEEESGGDWKSDLSVFPLQRRRPRPPVYYPVPVYPSPPYPMPPPGRTYPPYPYPLPSPYPYPVPSPSYPPIPLPVLPPTQYPPRERFPMYPPTQ